MRKLGYAQVAAVAVAALAITAVPGTSQALSTQTHPARSEPSRAEPSRAGASANPAEQDVAGSAIAVKSLLGVAHQGAHDGKRGQWSFGLDNNTLPAFAAATAHGFRNETDLRMSSNGVLYNIHEVELKVNSPNCTGLVPETTSAVIDTCRTKNGFPLPRLGQTVAQVVADGGTIQIELKEDPRIDADLDSYISRIVRIIRKAGGREAVWLEATKVAYLKAFARVAPKFKVAWKAGSTAVTGAQAVRLSVDAVILYPQSPATQVAEMHANGLSVLSRGTRTTTAWDRLVANGFDGGLTNDTPEFEAWKNSP
jgi:glycerophosphoryl diester phosphodiesterase